MMSMDVGLLGLKERDLKSYDSVWYLHIGKVNSWKAMELK